jgi:hypothetical protein
MKTLFLSLIISSFSILSSAQDKITGFGKLQLGITVNDIPELSKATKISSSSQYYSIVYVNRSRSSYEIVCDTNEQYPQGDYDTRIRQFQIGNYDLTDNINVENLTLKFFNDTLYYIQIEDRKMSELLKTKYGEGKTDLKEEEHTFQNGYGAKFVKTDQRFKTEWDSGSPYVNCTYILSSFYSDKGKQSVISFALLENSLHNEDIKTKNKMIKERIAKNKEEKKKAEIKGF